ncbi:ABC transporter ATP-binding protein [Chromatiales bacterium (ex Bugula neritina AB1)]|nr:ABC transporter ATP-binding protein [Chromatiales bacterium (ex Bugula neritina AB1)]
MTPVLEVKEVTVRFGGVLAVDNASVTLGAGDLIGFVGPNGAGKTTLMRVITGIIKPQHGSVWLEGRDLAGLSINQRVRAGLALAQQIVQPLRGMSVLSNVILACGSAKTVNPFKAMKSFARHAEIDTALQLLTRVGLQDVADAKPSNLPLGYLKRLEVARALALNPKLLLLDEPLAGLNQSEASALADLIRTLNQDGLSILLIEHNLREVMRICPQVYVQDLGKSLAFGEAKIIMSRPDVMKAYLGTS